MITVKEWTERWCSNKTLKFHPTALSLKTARQARGMLVQQGEVLHGRGTHLRWNIGYARCEESTWPGEKQDLKVFMAARHRSK